MALIRCCRLMAALLAAFIFSSSTPLWGQGFPRGHGDALGPSFKAAPGVTQNTTPTARERGRRASLERNRD